MPSVYTTDEVDVITDRLQRLIDGITDQLQNLHVSITEQLQDVVTRVTQVENAVVALELRRGEMKCR